jgi:hypothetical protein
MEPTLSGTRLAGQRRSATMAHTDASTPPASIITRPLEGFGWIVGAAALAFATSAVFSGVFHLQRGVFVLPYFGVVAVFLFAFFRRSQVDWSTLTRGWLLGLVGAVGFGAFVVMNILSQPASAAPEGLDLAWSVLWFGIAYGLADALLLNVMPVIAIQGVRFWDERPGRSKLVLYGAISLAASLAVTAAYHLGYAEFRGATLVAPVFGNALLTLSYLLTRSPLAPIGAHIAMHVAGVLHGMESVAQLPPHY